MCQQGSPLLVLFLGVNGVPSTVLIKSLTHSIKDSGDLCRLQL